MTCLVTERRVATPTQHSQAFPLSTGPWLPMDQALAPTPLSPVFGSQTGSSGGPPGPGGKRPSGEPSGGSSHPKSHRTGASQTLAATSGLASPGLRRLLRGGTCRGTAGSSGSRSSMQTHPSACPSLQGCTDQSQNQAAPHSPGTGGWGWGDRAASRAPGAPCSKEQGQARAPIRGAGRLRTYRGSRSMDRAPAGLAQGSGSTSTTSWEGQPACGSGSGCG